MLVQSDSIKGRTLNFEDKKRVEDCDLQFLYWNAHGLRLFVPSVKNKRVVI